MVGVSLFGLALPCGAAELQDPTRPPGMETLGGIDTPQPGAVGPVLQAVTLSKSRKVAVISGQEVPLGGRYGEAKLIRLSDSEAVLRNPDGTLQTLSMYTRVEKKVLTPAAGKRKKMADKK
ncbi:MAG: hypothetical protein N2Z69_09035 [Methylophilaceae bacterium]|nr:hypothetical protein [Methylophilaceae bacterium]